ncbi:MAG: hypothetical protein ACRDOL_13190 [Streptosporangiaceae bacterium]
MPPRRIPRPESRTQFWVEQLTAAGDGKQALSDAWRWLLSSLSTVAGQRPETAEAAAWDMARQIAVYASRLPKARIPLRRGLDPAEVWRLLNPWAPDEEAPR